MERSGKMGDTWGNSTGCGNAWSWGFRERKDDGVPRITSLSPASPGWMMVQLTDIGNRSLIRTRFVLDTHEFGLELLDLGCPWAIYEEVSGRPFVEVWSSEDRSREEICEPLSYKCLSYRCGWDFFRERGDGQGPRTDELPNLVVSCRRKTLPRIQRAQKSWKETRRVLFHWSQGKGRFFKAVSAPQWLKRVWNQSRGAQGTVCWI